MEIETRIHDDRTVLRVKGAVAGKDVAQYSVQLEAVRDSPAKQLLVDLTHVTMLDSTVIGATAYSNAILKKAGVNLVVLAPNRIKEIFALCNLDKAIRVIGTGEIISPEELLATKGDVK